MRILHKEIEHCEECPGCRFEDHGGKIALKCGMDDTNWQVVRRAYDFDHSVQTTPPKFCPLPETKP